MSLIEPKGSNNSHGDPPQPHAPPSCWRTLNQTQTHSNTVFILKSTNKNIFKSHFETDISVSSPRCWIRSDLFSDALKPRSHHGVKGEHFRQRDSAQILVHLHGEQSEDEQEHFKLKGMKHRLQKMLPSHENLLNYVINYAAYVRRNISIAMTFFAVLNLNHRDKPDHFSGYEINQEVKN